MVDTYERESRRVSRRVLRGFSPERFVALRKSKMSTSDLARLSRVTASTLYAWQKGTFTPQVDKLAAVMKVLATPIEQVVLIPRDQRFPGDWRVLSGLTQPVLASSAGIATSKLQRIESGESQPTTEQVNVLSSLLGATAEEYWAAWLRARDRPPGTPV